MRTVGMMGKIKTSKNEYKLAEIGHKFGKIQLFLAKIHKNSHFFQINILLV